LSTTAAINNQIYISGSSSSAHNITADIHSVTTGNAFMLGITGDNIVFNDCHIVATSAATSSANTEGIRMQGNSSIVSGCRVSNLAYGIRSNGQYNTITGNTVLPSQNHAGIYITAANNVVTGNFVKANQNNAKGIHCNSSASYTTITGNQIIGQATSGAGHSGIELDGSAVECTISGNTIRTWTTGINVNTSSNNHSIVGNTIANYGTAITNNGTGTFYQTATDSDPLNKIV